MSSKKSWDYRKETEWKLSLKTGSDWTESVRRKGSKVIVSNCG